MHQVAPNSNSKIETKNICLSYEHQVACAGLIGLWLIGSQLRAQRAQQMLHLGPGSRRTHSDKGLASGRGSVGKGGRVCEVLGLVLAAPVIALKSN